MSNQEYNLKCENRTEIQRDLHKNRVAFIIINNEIYYIEKSDKSHFELAQELGINKEQFDELCRGFFYQDYIVFYKGHFIYDDKLVEEGLRFVDKIKTRVGVEKVKVYCGQKVGKPNEIWPPDKFIGEY